MSLNVLESNIHYLNYFKALGLAPFSLTNPDMPTTPEIIALTIAFQILNIFDFVFTVTQVRMMFTASGTVSSISLTLQYISGCFALFIIFCESYLTRQSHKNLLKEFKEIDSILEPEINTLKIDVKDLVPKKMIVIGLTAQMVLLFAIASVSMIEDGLGLLFLCQMSALFFVYTRFIQLMFYLVLVIERLVVYKKVIKGRAANLLRTEDLWVFKKFFGALDRANSCFNEAFGSSVLIISVQNFVQAITNIYEIVMIVGGFEQSRSLVEMIVELLCVLILLHFFTMLVSRCNSIKQKIFDKLIMSETTDSKMLHDIFLCNSNEITITALQFYKMDKQAMHTIAATIFTYLGNAILESFIEKQ